MYAQSRYHKLLRVSLLVTAFILIFDSGMFTPVSRELSDNALQYVASSIGVTVGVPPNEINEITAELSAQERELDERELELTEREITARDFGGSGEATDYSIYILSTILFMLTVLITLNYALDFTRARRLAYERTHI